MSKENVLLAEKRDRAGKGAARATRRAGLVPAVVYGNNQDPVSISMDPRIVWKGLNAGHFFSTVYTIEVDGGSKEQALVRDVQFHPVTDAVMHIDFGRVTARTKVTVNVPVHFENVEESIGVKAGGIFSTLRHEVELMCSASNIPQEVSADVLNVDIGDTIRVSDLALPDNVESAITDRDPVVASISAPKVASEAEDEDAEEGVEGEEGATEEAGDEAASEE